MFEYLSPRDIRVIKSVADRKWFQSSPDNRKKISDRLDKKNSKLNNSNLYLQFGPCRSLGRPNSFGRRWWADRAALAGRNVRPRRAVQRRADDAGASVVPAAAVVSGSGSGNCFVILFDLDGKVKIFQGFKICCQSITTSIWLIGKPQIFFRLKFFLLKFCDFFSTLKTI